MYNNDVLLITILWLCNVNINNFHMRISCLTLHTFVVNHQVLTLKSFIL
jgi:hypothetical protein